MSESDPIGGSLPSGWTRSEIGEICDRSGGEVQTGPFGSQLHAEDYVLSGIPYVMPKDMIDGQISQQTVARVSEQDASRLATHRLRPGDILYARRGDIGRRALVTDREEGWLCGTGCLRIRTNCASLLPDYLTTYLGHPAVRKWVEDRAQGATMLNLNTTILRRVPVRIPPLAEQRRIVETLDKADGIRRKRKEAIALTEELLRSAFLEMFGDPVTNPKGWPLSTIGLQIEDMEYGPRFVNEKYSDDGVRIVRITDLDFAGGLDFESMPRLSVTPEERKRYALRAGDVLFARTGATVGKTALIRPSDPECIAGAYFIRLRFKSRVTPLFARMALSSERIQTLIARRSRQSAQQNFSGPGLRELPMPLPPSELQTHFQRVHAAIVEIGARQSAALEQSEALFASLLHRAFRGELTAPAPKSPTPHKKQLSFLE